MGKDTSDLHIKRANGVVMNGITLLKAKRTSIAGVVSDLNELANEFQAPITCGRCLTVSARSSGAVFLINSILLSTGAILFN